MCQRFHRSKEDSRIAALQLQRYGANGIQTVCEWPGCEDPAKFPAPRSRDRLREFRYYCLTHIRVVNAHWDYFAGMSPAQIEEHRRADSTWHRPTWRSGQIDLGSDAAWQDWFELFRDRTGRGGSAGETRVETQADLMMKRLELSFGFSLNELKSRYKVLVKRHHPDLHAGDKEAEERLKLINEAYTYLIENQIYC